MTADFNGDGKLDLAVGGPGSDISILLGNGDGTFQPSVTYPVGSTQTQVATGDFNQDGIARLGHLQLGLQYCLHSAR